MKTNGKTDSREIIFEDIYDDISSMIEKGAETPTPASPEEMEEALNILSDTYDEEEANDPDIQRYNSIGSYELDVVRDGSDEYFQALTDAIMALASGDHGSIDYRGYKIYYTSAPRLTGVSLKDGHREYRYDFSFHCDALSMFVCEEYHSEEAKKNRL